MQYLLTDQIESLLGQHGRGSGINRAFLCPLHDEGTPSFSIHMDEGLWYCFGCGKGGNLEQLYRLMGEKPTDEQRQDLLIRSVNRKPEVVRNFAPLANAYVNALAGRRGQSEWQRFIRTRPIAAESAHHFGVGYSDEKGALTFPYWKSDDTVCGIKYRYHDGSKGAERGSTRWLFGLPDCEGRGTVLIAEGESDALAAWSRLPRNVGVCGSPGAGVSEGTWRHWSVGLLFARRIYVAFDADEPGDKGGDTAMRVLGSERCIRIRPTKGKDLSEHIMNGGTLVELGVEEADDQPYRIMEHGDWVEWRRDTDYPVVDSNGDTGPPQLQTVQHDREYQPQS